MTKTLLATFLVASIVSFSLISCGSGGASGSGVSDKPSTKYRSEESYWVPVNDCAALKAIGNDIISMSKNYYLTADIDLIDVVSGFPLGWKSDDHIISFTGSFDGNGKTISNLVINKNTDNYIGLFSKIESVGNKVNKIEDMILDNFNMAGNSYIGALAGHVGGKIKGDIKISKIMVKNAQIRGISGLGGLMGDVEGAIITDSVVMGGEIRSLGKMSSDFGGLVGHMSLGAIISNSYASLDVEGINGAGGLVGVMSGSGAVLNSYSSGNVTGTHKGGLVGRLSDCSTIKCKITNSYFDASIDSSVSAVGVGGINANISGTIGVAGAEGIVLKDDGKFYTKGVGRNNMAEGNADDQIFINWNKEADIWRIDEGKWPTLQWQWRCKQEGRVAIYDIAGLKAIDDSPENMAKNYCLTDDIDLAGVTSGFPLGWNSVSDNILSFTGSLDGEDNKISNLVVNKSTFNYVGLFAKYNLVSGKKTEIKNLILENFEITGAKHVGSLIGHATGGVAKGDFIIKKVTIKNIKIIGETVLGGIMGDGVNVMIMDSIVEGGAVVSTKKNGVGGFVGVADGLSISNSYAKVDVAGVEGIDGIGGLIGAMSISGSILNSYFAGVLTGQPKGGLVGKLSNCTTIKCKITNSYFDNSTDSSVSAAGVGEHNANISGTIGVAGARDIVMKSGSKYYAKSTGAYDSLDKDDKQIFIDWDQEINHWRVEKGKWPTFRNQCQRVDWKAIYDVAGLKAMGRGKASMAKNYCLIADIDLANETGVNSGFPLGWRPISDSMIPLSDSIGGDDKIINIIPFTGSFDGEGHTISSLVVNNRAYDYMGLFAKIELTGDASSMISNLNLNDIKIIGAGYVGALAGEIKGEVTVSKVAINKIEINGKSDVGGLIGSIKNGVQLVSSFVIGGGVIVQGNHAGGLVGSVNDSIISSSYATSSVLGDSTIGGLVGVINNKGGVSNSYSIGKVTAINGASSGGLIGELSGCTMNNCSVTNSYFDKSVNSGIADIGSGKDDGTTASLVGVDGTGDIGVDADGGFQRVASPNDKIFIGWNINIWKIKEGAWPTIKE